MSLKFQESRGRAKLQKARQALDPYHPFGSEIDRKLKEANKKISKSRIMPERKKALEKLAIAPGKQLKLYGKIVTVERVDNNCLVRVVGRAGRFLPQEFEPAKN